jgi:Ser/Thr protein kinase RdoA (MazF antagonist)
MERTDPITQAIAYFKLDVASIQPVEGSYSSIVRILTLQGGDRLVLKIPFVQRKLQRELNALQHLQADLPVPQELDVWLPDDDQPGALLLSLLPGKIITGKVSQKLAYSLGELLARLHTHELPRFGDDFDRDEPEPAGWWELLDQAYKGWQPLCEQVLPVTLIQRTLIAYDRLYRSLPDPDGPCYVHYDFRPGNVLVQRGRISGLIDFESARGGSADYDFIKIKNEVWDVSPDTRAPFLAGYQSIRDLPDIEHTLPLYRLHNAYGAIAWCVRRAKLDDPFYDENLRRLMKILDSIET